jgi:hypothetical protein
MSQQLRAIRRTAGMLAISTLVPVAIMGLFQLSGETLTWILFGAFCTYFLWMVYSINLGQIKHDDELKEIDQRYRDAVSNKQV